MATLRNKIRKKAFSWSLGFTTLLGLPFVIQSLEQSSLRHALSLQDVLASAAILLATTLVGYIFCYPKAWKKCIEEDKIKFQSE